ncbi:UbiA prenyltransferase family protein [Patescibacteria group bacterium]|nr:UbiA prenyltransferase family protein [Patescibacteria group bacterium]
MVSRRVSLYLRLLRVNQWIKNLVVFTAIIFSGKLFDAELTVKSFYAFFIFCLLSSTSYVLNDIIDYQFDRKHPIKRYRPVASGEITIPQATFLAFVLTIVSLVVALIFARSLFFLALVFILLHFLYSLYLKRYPVIDIFTISFSFMVRTLAGEVASGYHIPIWLFLTIFFVSLFMAAIKRQAELGVVGRGARTALVHYNKHFLDFLTYTFATATIIAYATYTYVERPSQATTPLTRFFVDLYPDFEARKWMMVTIPLVVYGISRYAQLLYEKAEGERPEKIITTDPPLVATVFLWGTVIIGLIYLF